MKTKLMILLATIILIPFIISCTASVKDNSVFSKQQVQEKGISRGMPGPNYGPPAPYGAPYGYRNPYNPYYQPSPDDEQAVRQYDGKPYFFGKHFTSWSEWSRYLIAHPDMTRYGKYFYDGTQMMFRFCDPNTNQCFFFIIDR